MDGVEELTGVVVVGATNRPDILDPALLRPGRFDLMLEVRLPDESARREILEVALRGRPLEAAVNLEELAQRTEGLSGADLEAVCNRAAMSAIRCVVQQGDIQGKGERRVLITRAHLEEALAGAGLPQPGQPPPPCRVRR
jgi:transitional endoplasmic reticulum ATPase